MVGYHGSGENGYVLEDYQFQPLKCRTESFKKFFFARRGQKLEVEGFFVHNSEDSQFYSGYLDSEEDYKVFQLRPPEKPLRIWCIIPLGLISREKLLSKPNLRLIGRIHVDANKSETKHLLVDEVKVIPIKYTNVGLPEFDGLQDMFSEVYTREIDIYEKTPVLLLASLIGSEKKSLYFPDENVGCGINIGEATESSPGRISYGVVRGYMRENLEQFIKTVNVGPLNQLTDKFKWNRFLSIHDPTILARNTSTNTELDWNLLSPLNSLKKLKKSEFLASDINLAFHPDLFPPKIKKDVALKIKQTILFAKSTPSIDYSKRNLNALMEVKTEELVKSLAKNFDYARFLFRFRLEPLCDAYIKGNHLLDYLTYEDIKVKRGHINEFFKIADKVAREFAEYAEEYIDPEPYTGILDETRDKRIQEVYIELLVKGRMKKEEMRDFLIKKYDLIFERAETLVGNLTNLDHPIVKKDGEYFVPI